MPGQYDIFICNLQYHSINCYSVSESAFTDLVHLDNTNSDFKLNQYHNSIKF
jgi:hypothetical protein